MPTQEISSAPFCFSFALGLGDQHGTCFISTGRRRGPVAGMTPDRIRKRLFRNTPDRRNCRTHSRHGAHRSGGVQRGAVFPAVVAPFIESRAHALLEYSDRTSATDLRSL